jgi:hypothetical protein
MVKWLRAIFFRPSLYCFSVQFLTSAGADWKGACIGWNADDVASRLPQGCKILKIANPVKI